MALLLASIWWGDRVTDVSSSAFPSAHFNLSVARGSADEFELWRWGVSPMFDVDAVDANARPDFSMSADVDHFAGMALATTRSAAMRFARTDRVVAQSGMDSILFQVYESGSYRLKTDGHEALVKAGDIVVLDLTRRCEILAEAFSNFSIVLPRQMLEPLVANIDDIHGLILRQGTSLNALLRSHMQMLQAQALTFPEGSRSAVTQATASLLAACVGPSIKNGEMANKALSAASLRVVKRAIDSDLANPALGPDLLARQFNMSRASLYRLFEPVGGVRKYIQQRRLARSHQDLFDPAFFGQRVGGIAKRWGFSDHTVFCRSFRDTYGMTPTDVREFAQNGFQEAVRSNASNGSFWALNRWLYGLEQPAFDRP